MATKKSGVKKAVASKPVRKVGRPRKAATLVQSPVIAPAARVETTQPKTQPQAQAQTAPFGEFDVLVSHGTDNVAAVIESGNALAKGLDGLNQEILAIAGASLDHNIEAAKALIGAKTLNDVVGLQRAYAQHSLDLAMAESARLTELGAQVARDALSPIQSRVTLAIETAVSHKAA